MLIDASWSWLIQIDASLCWLMLMLIDTGWCWLMLFDADWCWLVLIDADVDWCRLMLRDAREWHKAESTHVPWTSIFIIILWWLPCGWWWWWSRHQMESSRRVWYWFPNHCHQAGRTSQWCWLISMLKTMMIILVISSKFWPAIFPPGGNMSAMIGWKYVLVKFPPCTNCTPG